jgi:hypothetical protein
MRWIDVATEDPPSTAVARRLVAEMPGFSIGYMLGERGNGYLRQRMPSFRQMAFTRPLLILTDLDRSICPSALIGDWMGNSKCPPRIIFRVVVRAIEAWLLADHEAMAALLGPRVVKDLPSTPDEVADPKAAFVGLARKAPRDVRLDICPAAGSQSSRGVNYNNRLTDFIATRWDPRCAALRSPSLRRARARLAALAKCD